MMMVILCMVVELLNLKRKTEHRHEVSNLLTVISRQLGGSFPMNLPGGESLDRIVLQLTAICGGENRKKLTV